MSEQFSRTVTVSKHANYGAFQGDDNKFYKPPKEMSLNDFAVGTVHQIKGYCSDSGKTNYITTVGQTGPVDGTFTDTDKKPRGRRLPKTLPREDKKAIPGDNKETEEKSKTISTGERDFVKEAKGKTFSLIVAGLAHNYSSLKTNSMKASTGILNIADELLKGIEDRGYF